MAMIDNNCKPCYKFRKFYVESVGMMTIICHPKCASHLGYFCGYLHKTLFSSHDFKQQNLFQLPWAIYKQNYMPNVPWKAQAILTQTYILKPKYTMLDVVHFSMTYSDVTK